MEATRGNGMGETRSGAPGERPDQTRFAATVACSAAGGEPTDLRCYGASFLALVHGRVGASSARGARHRVRVHLEEGSPGRGRGRPRPRVRQKSRVGPRPGSPKDDQQTGLASGEVARTETGATYEVSLAVGGGHGSRKLQGGPAHGTGTAGRSRGSEADAGQPPGQSGPR